MFSFLFGDLAYTNDYDLCTVRNLTLPKYTYFQCGPPDLVRLVDSHHFFYCRLSSVISLACYMIFYCQNVVQNVF